MPSRDDFKNVFHLGFFVMLISLNELTAHEISVLFPVKLLNHYRFKLCKSFLMPRGYSVLFRNTEILFECVLEQM